ncbi:MAG TPA: OsmC family protein [Candidatus Krumholzibacteria bacterium]|nr:OsmC family protein [Candidatus Krumholzibacteria bacterium]
MKPNSELSESIKTAFERNGRAMELRPAVGQKTAVTVVRVVEGAHAVAEEGRWKVSADLSEKSGGTAQGPDPGLLVRSALGTCLAMGYVIWAAHLGVPVSNVEVEIQADFDARGQHDVPGVDPGFSEVRYHVRIQSDAPQADIERVVETSDRASMVGDVFRRAHTLKRTLSVTRKGA